MSPKNLIKNSSLDTYTPTKQDLERTNLLLDIFEECENKGIKISIFGGYGLDSLYGKLTRGHEDIDISISKEDEEVFVKIIKAKGFVLEKGYFNPKEYKMEYLKEGFLLEYTTDDRLKYFPGMKREEFFPEKINGKLLGRAVRTPTLKGHKWMIEIQNKRAVTFGWGDYKHRQNQNLLIKALEER